MRSLFTSRLLRCIICLLLICCVLVQISPLKVRATSAVVSIVKAATVTGNPYVIVGAALIALGVMVGTETGAFETVVDNAVSFLDTAGGWIENGTMQLLQTVDSTGQAMYYAAGDLFETLRGWVYSDSIVYEQGSGIEVDSGNTFTLLTGYYTYDHYVTFNSAVIPYYVSYTQKLNTGVVSTKYEAYFISTVGSFTGSYCQGGFSQKISEIESSSYTHNGVTYHYWNYGTTFDSQYVPYSGFCSHISTLQTMALTISAALSYIFGEEYVLNQEVTTDYDLSLGVVPTVPIDGTSAREWAPDYANKGLKVIEGGGGTDPDNDGSDGKWFLPLALTLTAAELYLLSQADEWSAVTPPEFADNVSTSTEFEILSTPEIDGYQGIEIQPVTDPDTGGDSGTSTEPTTGEDTDPTTGSDPDTGGSSNPDSGSDSDPDTNPDTNPDADSDTNPDTDPDAGTDTGTDAWSPSGDMQHFTLDLKDYFPFCIPFDLYDFFTCLNADPVAPVIEWVIPLPGGETYPLELDLAVFDDVAQLLRRLQLLLFCVGLAFKTRDLIKG